MERKFLYSGAGVILVFGLCVAYIFGAVLDTPLLRSSPTITVEMPRTGGLFQGSEVTYRGSKVGRVTDLELDADGVVATVKLTGSEQIPRDTVAQVRSLSPVGEQYLDLRPKSTGGPYLADGAVITAEAVDLPQTIGNTAISLNKLIEQVEPRQIQKVLGEISTGLSGTEQDLRRIVVQGSELLATFDENLPLATRVLNQGRTVLQIGADKTTTLERLSSDAALFAAWLRRYDPEFFRLLEQSPGQVETLRKLVKDVGDTLPPLLDPAITMTDLLAARDPHLRELLVQFPRGLNALASTIRFGAIQLDVLGERGRKCDYDTVRREATDVSFRPLQTGGFCSTSLTISQRGAQHAPGPVR